MTACASQAIVPTSLPTHDVKSTTQPSTAASSTATSVVENTFTTHSYCPEISHDIASRSDLMGTIVLGGKEITLGDQEFSSDSGKSVLLFWQPRSGKKVTYPLPGAQMYYYYVASPNKEYLALTEGKTLEMSSDVIVLTKDGQEEAIFSLPGNWTLFDWLNNDQLLVRQLRLMGTDHDLIAINPFTDKQQSLESDFPNIYSQEPLVFWGALTIFDSTLSRVVYPVRQKNTLNVVVRDVDSKREIASISDGDLPRWALDGKRLLLVVEQDPQRHRFSDEIYIVSDQGEINRATFLSENLETSIISLPVWSPDGRYIAFWLSNDIPIKTAKLAVLDTETFSMDLYCDEINPFPYRYGENGTLGYTYYQVNAAPPIWSPDSQNLLIEDYQNFTSNSYLFDLKNHAITQIAEETRPVGWLK
jgi:hypothetical protein